MRSSVVKIHGCIGCKDPWLREVQDEMRAGNLSQISYDFLHGHSTSVPGSYLHGRVSCGNERCEHLATEWEDCKKEAMPLETYIAKNECSECRRERDSRRLVASGPDDPRFHSEKFSNAPGIFANNDIKYDVSKQRAQFYARARK